MFSFYLLFILKSIHVKNIIKSITEQSSEIKYEEFKKSFCIFVNLIRNELFFEVKESLSFTFSFEVFKQKN
jgi:hypothetical protein